MESELIAIPVFQERISPLFDEARKFVLFEAGEGRIIQKSTVPMSGESSAMRVIRLREVGVTTIICGAVSGYLSGVIAEQGLILYSWQSGPVDEVIALYLSGGLKQAEGCGKPCRGTGRSCGRGMFHGKRVLRQEEKIL